VNLKKVFPARGGNPFVRSDRTVKAVDGVSFTVKPGEVVAIVGESGCGKSTLGRLVIGLLEPTSGAVRVDEEDVTHASSRNLAALRSKAQIVFQDSLGSLNPRMTVGEAIAYPMKVNGVFKRGEGRALQTRVTELLEKVGLNPAHERRLPHELSGGQRQRVGIARALALNPKLLVLDEPVSALDLSAQARVLNLFKELQRELGMAYLFITHDLGVAEYMADRIIVMYAGKIVQIGDRASVFRSPRHPYTEALFSAAVLDAGSSQDALVLDGDPPSAITPPPGCRFNTRCPRAVARCFAEEPEFVKVSATNEAACYLLAGEVDHLHEAQQA
jgi:oligopeptide/dipeptide ABC transporter ATP-binding protein